MSEPRHPEDDRRVAAPPDAGHLGSFTTPEDLLFSPPGDADAPFPPLSSDPVRAQPESSTRTAVLSVILLVVVLGLSLTGICQA